MTSVSTARTPDERSGPRLATLSSMSAIERSLAQTVRPEAPPSALLARRALIALGLLVFVVATLGGVVRLGWFPTLAPPLARAVLGHGPWMVCGFLGAVIGVEHAAAQSRAWPYLAPLSIGVGGVLSLPLAVALGAVVLLLEIASRRARTQEAAVSAIAAAALLGAAIQSARGAAVFQVVPWWMVFLVATILGELAEEGQRAPAAFVALGAAALPATWLTADAVRVVGLSLALLGAWTVGVATPRRALGAGGSAGHVARAVLAAGLWAIVGGGLLLLRGLPPAGPTYDAIVHAILVGFVLSMLFGHGPVVLPQLVGRSVRHDARFLAPFVVLEVGLVARVVGDLANVPALRVGGGAANGVAVALFLLSVASASRAAPRQGVVAG